VYKGLKESGARPGQTVAIVGAGGGLGSLAQQYAKAMGLRVIAIDTYVFLSFFLSFFLPSCITILPVALCNEFYIVHPRRPKSSVVANAMNEFNSGDDKKKMSLEKLGAATFVDFMKDDVVTAVKKATPDGLGPHAVILVAVTEKPFQQAAEYVRPRGTVICIGLPAGAYLKAPVFDSVIKMVTIKGSYVGNRKVSLLDATCRRVVY